MKKHQDIKVASEASKNIDVTKTIMAALDNPEVPKIYANSFSLALGAGDVAILLNIGHKATGVLNLSYTTAKTLSVKIQQLISLLEDKSKQPIMTVDEVNKYLIEQDGTKNDNL